LISRSRRHHSHFSPKFYLILIEKVNLFLPFAMKLLSTDLEKLAMSEAKQVKSSFQIVLSSLNGINFGVWFPSKTDIFSLLAETIDLYCRWKKIVKAFSGNKLDEKFTTRPSFDLLHAGLKSNWFFFFFCNYRDCDHVGAAIN
jgi:hypothetical protein